MTSELPTTMTTVSVLYGGVIVPAEQVVRFALPAGHKMVCDGKTLDDGTEVTFVVRTKPGTSGTSGYANLLFMSPGMPQMVGGCHVHAKARGKGRWVEWDGCRDVAEWVKRFVVSQYIHFSPLPEAFAVVERQ